MATKHDEPVKHAAVHTPAPEKEKAPEKAPEKRVEEKTVAVAKLPADTQLRNLLERAVTIIKNLPRRDEHDEASYNAFLEDAEKVLG